MTNPTQSGASYTMQCSEFEALLADALDGVLTGERMAQFRSHSSACATCGPLFAEAESGRKWLTSLAEIAPPRHLVHNILLATSGLQGTREQAATEPRASFWFQLKHALNPQPLLTLVMEPRFGLSMAMAFFSVSLAMNVAGVKISDLQKMDLRPSAINRTYHETQSRVVHYYDNIRFVYEVESRVRELRKTLQPSEPAPTKQQNDEPEQKQQKNESDKNSQPEHQQNYLSESQRDVLLAREHSPIVNLEVRRTA